MPDKPCYDITLEDQDIVVRFNRNIIDPDRVTKFLDYLELEAIRKRSRNRSPGPIGYPFKVG